MNWIDGELHIRDTSDDAGSNVDTTAGTIATMLKHRGCSTALRGPWAMSPAAQVAQLLPQLFTDQPPAGCGQDRRAEVDGVDTATVTFSLAATGDYAHLREVFGELAERGITGHITFAGISTAGPIAERWRLEDGMLQGDTGSIEFSNAWTYAPPIAS